MREELLPIPRRRRSSHCVLRSALHRRQWRPLARRVAFDRGTRGRPLDRIDRTLAHLFWHQTHHRGQAHAMLSGTFVAPPQLDEFLMETDAQFREAYMKAVGMVEADLAP